MGKSFCSDKAGLRISIIAFILLLGVCNIEASHREFALFDSGYKYYLSYQPEKAAEEFRIFLKEFPHSSAKDAVLFWLGKSLMQLKSPEEAENVFLEIKQQFPDSPFIVYIKKELEIIPKLYDKNNKVTIALPDEPGNIKSNDVKIALSEDRVNVQENEIQKQEIQKKEGEEKEAGKEHVTPSPEPVIEKTPQTGEIKADTEDKSKKADQSASTIKKRNLFSVQMGVFKHKKTANDLQVKLVKTGYPVKVINVTSKNSSVYKVMAGAYETRKEAESNALKLKRAYGLNTMVSMYEVSEQDIQPEKPEEQKITDELEIQEKGLSDEQEKIGAQVQTAAIEKGQTELTRELMSEKMTEYNQLEIKIREKRYTMQEIFDYMMSSQSMINKLGMKEILWRSGNVYDDFIIEQILYDESKNINTSSDMNMPGELIEKYQLNSAEADYLHRYLSINELIHSKIKELPEEKVVESLNIQYQDGDKQKKIGLSTEIQMKAKNGISFEDIYKSYSDIISYAITNYKDIQEGLKEKMQFMQNNEVIVIWSEVGYRVLKPVTKNISLKPFVDISPEMRDKIRTYLGKWLNDLKKDNNML